MQRLLHLLLLCFFVQSMCGQDKLKLVPYLKGNLFGYSDLKGNIIVPCLFDNAENFKNGFGMVRSGKNNAVYNDRGKQIIAMTANEVLILECGLIAVRKDYQWGIFDSSGKQIREYDLKNVYDFDANFFRGKNSSYKNFLFNKNAKEITVNGYDDIDTKTIQGNFVPVSKNYKWGLLDLKEGKEIGDFIHGKISNFSSGIAITKEKYNTNYYLIDTNGIVIKTSFIADELLNNAEGMIVFKKEGLFGYINRYGKIVSEPVYTKASAFEGGAGIVKMGEGYGLIRKNGGMALECEYNSIHSLKQGYFAVEKKGKYSLVDSTGKFLSAFEFDGLIPFKDNGLIPFVKGDKYGYISIKGKIVVAADFTSAGAFENGIAIVEKNGKTGAIDTEGHVLIAFQYTSLGRFDKNGIAAVNKKRQKFFIHTSGKEYCDNLSNQQFTSPKTNAEKLNILKGMWQPLATINNTGKESELLSACKLIFYNDSTFYFESATHTYWGYWNYHPNENKIALTSIKTYRPYSASETPDQELILEKMNSSEIILRGKLNFSSEKYRAIRMCNSPAFDENILHGTFTKNYAGSEQLEEKGTYRAGKKSGLWQTWYRDGKLRSSGNYLEGKKQFDWKYYNRDGISVTESEMGKTEKTEAENIVYDPMKNGEYQDTWHNGSLKKLGRLKNGLEEGMWICWNENGDKSRQGNYTDGKKTGMWISWENSGKNRTETEYLNGQPVGASITRDENDFIIEKGNYLNGKKEGKWEGRKSKYSSGGTYEEYYVEGKLEGKRIEFDSKGKKTDEIFYEHDKKNGKSTHWNNSGIITSEIWFLDGKEDGSTKLYNTQGVLTQEKIYEQGIEKKQSYFELGYTVSEKTFLENDTAYYVYYTKGNKEREGKERKYNKEGLWKFYNPDHSLEKTAMYQRNKMHGITTYFYADGKIKKTEEYKYGRLDGETKEYSNEGKILKTTRYRNGISEN